MKSTLRFLILLLISMIMIPSLSFSAVTFDIDMDTTTAGIQTDIWVLPGQSFTTDVYLTLNDPGDSLLTFSYSLLWDNTEFGTPTNITQYAYLGSWVTGGPLSQDADNIFALSQFDLNGVNGTQSSYLIASIDWTATSPLTDGSADLTPGFFDSTNDGAFDTSYGSVSPVFNSGSVNLAPEPISSILFLTGGATLALRRLRRIKI